MASSRKELPRLLKEAQRQGWRVKDKKSGWMLMSPDGVTTVTIHKTSSDHRALANAISLMRAGGFRWKDR